ncbi:Guanylate kinase [Elusimicrobium minutum Pei191]|uniref:Guanylate kinase n=1 Tax=Elusimicrobium minutum (strain Pei191) TaxID=445932 RepID=B2KCZ6_ELUMP|nr:guanylate kinase [Elusimicrobium minutum]ACC98392.1 Guanylate kinase [Elusimicrobium minutum Pei191]
MDAFVLIVSSPSGGGKTTIVNELLKKDRTAKRVVTATTRSPRKGEKDGKDYHFWSVKKFQSAIKNNKMAEWANVFTDYYGVPKESLDTVLKKGLIPVLVIDVQGQKSIKKHYKNAVSVFILPPSWNELKKRLLARPGGTNNIDVRLKTAKKEVAQVKKFDYVIVNDKLDGAVNALSKIIFAEKHKTQRKKPAINRLKQKRR